MSLTYRWEGYRLVFYLLNLMGLLNEDAKEVLNV